MSFLTSQTNLSFLIKTSKNVRFWGDRAYPIMKAKCFSLDQYKKKIKLKKKKKKIHINMELYHSPILNFVKFLLQECNVNSVWFPCYVLQDQTLPMSWIYSSHLLFYKDLPACYSHICRLVIDMRVNRFNRGNSARHSIVVWANLQYYFNQIPLTGMQSEFCLVFMSQKYCKFKPFGDPE